jgi:GT2 family glycosyltransferase
VIVNWNTGDELRRCLASIREAAREGVALESVTIVDNASTDGSCDGLEAAGVPVRLVRNTDNRGFAAACNQGARLSGSAYLLFLNPDTQLRADSLRVPLAYMDDPAHAHVGICGIRLLTESGQPATSGARYPSLRVFLGQVTGLTRVLPSVFPRHLMDADECAARGVVDQVIGAYFLIRRPLFDTLGGFDERFFVYFEEVDLSLRAAQRGFVSFCLGTVSAQHIGGHSSNQVRALRLFYSLRSRLLYAGKHFRPASRLGLVALTFLIELPARLLRAVLGGSLPEAAETVRAYRLLLREGWDLRVPPSHSGLP